MAQIRKSQQQDYRLSANRYRELKYFCRQYGEKKRRLYTITEISPPEFRADVCSNAHIADNTAATACKRMQLQKDMQLIEQTAAEVGKDISRHLLKNVTEGIPYEYLDVPYSRRQFYRIRMQFFYLLSERQSEKS